MARLWANLTGRTRHAPAAALLLLLAGCSAQPSQVDTAQLAKWRDGIRQALFVPNPLPPLDPLSHGGFDVDETVVAQRVSYGTESGMRIPAILYLPRHPAGKIPGLLIVPGHGGDKYAWYASYAGVLYARGGAAVLTFDPVGEGERNSERRSGTNAHDRIEPIPEEGQRLAGWMVTDVMQGVSYLLQREEIDPNRVAVLGFSLGSFSTLLAGAIDQRPWVCVLAGGGNLDGLRGYWERSRPLCQGFAYQSLAFLGDRPAALYALHALRGPTLVVNGSEDQVVRMHHLGAVLMADVHERVGRLLGGRAEIFQWRIVPEGGHQPFFLSRQVASWLEGHLDFPSWTQADLESTPEILIGDWARAGNVDLGRTGQQSNRDAGTRALSLSIPALSRGQLTLFPLPEWEAQKDRLVMDSWVNRVHDQTRHAAR